MVVSKVVPLGENDEKRLWYSVERKVWHPKAIGKESFIVREVTNDHG
jgi:hypothetical protein